MKTPISIIFTLSFSALFILLYFVWRNFYIDEFLILFFHSTMPFSFLLFVLRIVFWPLTLWLLFQLRWSSFQICEIWFLPLFTFLGSKFISLILWRRISELRGRVPVGLWGEVIAFHPSSRRLFVGDWQFLSWKLVCLTSFNIWIRYIVPSRSLFLHW